MYKGSYQTAKAAGVSEVVMCSPLSNGVESQVTLAAAYVAGVDRLFNIGGAQAIAAMAYGTESIPSVHKICGPGNILQAHKPNEYIELSQIQACEKFFGRLLNHLSS